MERLTKTYFDGTHGANDNLPCGENSYTYKGLLLEALGKYEDAEEQGLLLRLPCKVGSILYQPIDNQINEYHIIGLRFDITRNKFMYEVTYHIGLDWYSTTCDFDYINEVVFLTREEAEQKLKEMESDNKSGKE